MRSCKSKKDVEDVSCDHGESTNRNQPDLGNFLRRKLSHLEEVVAGSVEHWRMFFEAPKVEPHGAGERDPTEHEPHRTNDTDRTTTVIN